jgi:hypothetical protein
MVGHFCHAILYSLVHQMPQYTCSLTSIMFFLNYFVGFLFSSLVTTEAISNQVLSLKL